MKVLVATLAVASGWMASAAEPPTPYGPVPSARQLQWQEMGFIGFIHFIFNTFTDREWGNGDESEKVFNPMAFGRFAEPAEVLNPDPQHKP